MHKPTPIALIAPVLLLSLAACEEYESLDEALQSIAGDSDNSPSQSGWLYINPTVGFVTTFPAGWSVAVEEGNSDNRKILFHNEKGAEFILRLKHMPGQDRFKFMEEIRNELKSCLPECCYDSTTPVPTIVANKAEGSSFDSTIFNAKSRTLIDQHIIVFKYKGWGFALIAQATTHVDNKVWTDAESDLNSISESFSFDLPTPTPVVCPTCTPSG
jgi:hypothetical protein